ncbi:hypothetical protein JZO70_08190 [Enterococcus sp. 669A]|uniref:Uncharacterized protein n=1 Tax=Candidatus Enterococcus moelleringii TaxID=2815325 RepID=A0ABS3L955_9ENTE|nr:hypothetical protein [Enterococcus sp. 669A]MBO1306137.1 hypothetical protein [Enterococcus sp. 669A]
MGTSDFKSKLLKDIEETGFPFEMEISSMLRNRGWHVSNGSYYIDKDENKGREIDVIAEIHKDQLISKEATLEVVFSLILEIKESKKKPWIFFTSDATSLIDSTIPKKYTSGGFETKPYRLNSLLRKYTVKAQDRIGRNFYIGFSGNGARDDIYKSLSGLTKALNHFMETDTNKDNKSEDRLFRYFEPIVIIKGDLFEAFINKKGTMELEESNYIQTYFNYLSPNYSNNAHNIIHVVSEKYFEEFISLQEKALQTFFDALIKENID